MLLTAMFVVFGMPVHALPDECLARYHHRKSVLYHAIRPFASALSAFLKTLREYSFESVAKAVD
jgi:hypothetical protein